MSLLAANLEVLEIRFPGLAPQILAPGDSDELRVIETPSGHPTLLAAEFHVHSGRDPFREASRLAESLPGREPITLLGFGLGYLGEALRRNGKDRPIVVTEKRPEVLRLALEKRDLRDFLGSGPLIFQIGGRADGIIAALQVFGEKTAVAVNPALRALDPSWYDEVELHLRFWNNKEEVNAATLKRFGRRWVANLAANLSIVPRYPGVAMLESCCRGFPVLILAAGPSLDRILPLLPEIAKRCVIIAVDTALRAALGAGVSPDFVLVVDPQYWNARHLDRCAAVASCLICETAVYPTVLRHPFRRIFLASTAFPLGRFVEDRVDPKGSLGAGGSVATTAWDLARLLGAGPLWIAGLDLGFPDLRTHFRGALFEERALAEACRLYPAETLSVRALRDGIPYYAPSANGDRVLTDRRLSLYAAWFAGRFSQYPLARPRSLSPGGLAIPGMDCASDGELLEIPIRRGEIDRELRETFLTIDREFSKKAKEREERYERALDQLLGGLRSFIRTAENASEEARGDGMWMTLQKTDVAEVASFLIQVPKGGERPGDSFYVSLSESARYTLDRIVFYHKGRTEIADTGNNGD